MAGRKIRGVCFVVFKSLGGQFKRVHPFCGSALISTIRDAVHCGGISSILPESPSLAEFHVDWTLNKTAVGPDRRAVKKGL
jgi:hypothetical protein